MEGESPVQARRAPESLLTPEALDEPSLEAVVMRNAVRERLFGGPPRVFQIDRFVVLERIGQGGMGVVFEAYDPKLERKIALKVLRPTTGEDGPVARQRMLREARALAKLSHPNVVPVFDAGEHDEHVFIAMELVRGHTLHEHARTPGRTVGRSSTSTSRPRGGWRRRTSWAWFTATSSPPMRSWARKGGSACWTSGSYRWKQQ